MYSENPSLVQKANVEAALIGSLQWTAMKMKVVSANEFVDSLDGDAIKIDCLKIASILDRKPVHDPGLCKMLISTSEDRRRRLRSNASLKRNRKRKRRQEVSLSVEFLDLISDDISDHGLDESSNSDLE